MDKKNDDIKQNVNCENLRSLLKKPGKKGKSNNHVIFNENKNEFFDADYIILIREECEYDADDNNEICTCTEVLPHNSCESNCNCDMYCSCEQLPQSPKYAPPMEFVDAVALSPPEGYKDMEISDKQIVTFQDLTSATSKTAVCRDCIANKKTSKEDSQDFQTLKNIETMLYNGQTAGSGPGIRKEGILRKQEQDFQNNIENTESKMINVPSHNDNTFLRAVHFIENNEVTKNHIERNGVGSEAGSDNESPQNNSEMVLTFNLENHIFLSNNSLKPNSAYQQLFPHRKTRMDGDKCSREQFVLSTEGLNAFNNVEISKPPHIIQSCKRPTNEQKNFRGPIIGGNSKVKKNVKKDDNSLVDRIKMLMCDFDETSTFDDAYRVSPTGEESHESYEIPPEKPLKSSPSSSSVNSNSSSVSTAYNTISDLLPKKADNFEINVNTEGNEIPIEFGIRTIQSNINSYTNVNSITKNTNQLLSTVVPLTICVNDSRNSIECCHEAYSHQINKSLFNSNNTEYKTEDKHNENSYTTENAKYIVPDVLDGTPSIMQPFTDSPTFTQQGVIDQMKKQCHQEHLKSEDDEHDDYGFNKRPKVQGLKTRFYNTTNEILRPTENLCDDSKQSGKAIWPYYSESTLIDKEQTATSLHEGINTAMFSARYQCSQINTDDISYQNYYNQRLLKTRDDSLDPRPAVVGRKIGCNECHPWPQKIRNSRSLSPPPEDFSHNYETMIYIPYNHLETCPSPNIRSNDTSKLNIDPLKRRYNHFCNQNLKTGVFSHSNVIQVLAHKTTDNCLLSNKFNASVGGSNDTSHEQTSAKSTQTSATPILTCSYFHDIKCKSFLPVLNDFHISKSSVNDGHNGQSGLLKYHPLPSKNDIVLQEEKKYFSRQVSSESDQYIDKTDYLLIKKINSPTTEDKLLERGVPEGAPSLPLSVPGNNTQNNVNVTTPPSSSYQKPFYVMNV